MAKRPSHIHLWFMASRWVRKFLQEEREWQARKEGEKDESAQ